MLKKILFIGPTLPAAVAHDACPDLEVRAPVGCGDVYRAVRDGAALVAIVDGYFDHQLSVWHKEILWALSKGTRVYGAASMGALRAAELSAFGMLGIGKVFEAFRSGQLECDDEVAVAHESSERGYAAVSEALVNVRATLAVAVQNGVIDQTEAQGLVAAARSLFYPQRTFPAILSRALQTGLSEASGARFQHWLGRDGARRVDQKRLDAEALLNELNAPRLAAPAPAFHFEYSEVWHEFVRNLALQPASLTSPGLSSTDAIEVDEAAIQAAADAFRRKHGLLTPEATQRWLDARGIDLATFSARMHDEAVAERRRATHAIR